VNFEFDPEVINGSPLTGGLTKAEAVKVIRIATGCRFSLKYYVDVLQYNLGSRTRYPHLLVGALIAAWYKSGDLG